MTKNLTIPETWGIPDDQANKVREALSKKTIRPEDRVQRALDELARDIAIIESDPEDWFWWASYLLEQLEGEADRRGKKADFGKMMKSFRGNLMDRCSG